MFVRCKATRNRTRIAIQIVESRRAGGKVRQTALEHLGTVDAGDEEAIERMKAEGRRRIESRSRQVLALPPEPGLLTKLEEPDPEESPVFGVDHGACDSEGSASVGVHQASGAL